MSLYNRQLLIVNRNVLTTISVSLYTDSALMARPDKGITSEKEDKLAQQHRGTFAPPTATASTPPPPQTAPPTDGRLHTPCSSHVSPLLTPGSLTAPPPPPQHHHHHTTTTPPPPPPPPPTYPLPQR
ncbi:hypothetical protein C0Q70_20598 [Pomacea canaliculata]|uniref:Uncharacterized protein n=1 Tax=Pomacea canaliculata TaxID=400727 RepID=A0A2T7NG05_POMCA|nr:hypothetical protein C0Q70_20598 [Pomacea canaliculata]